MASSRSLLALALALIGCGSDTSLDLTLVADPNVNDASMLVEQLRSLRVVISAPGGLYATPPASPGDGLRLEDVDGDGQLDLVAERAVSGLDRLPRIRLERGGLRSAAIDLRLDGATPCRSGELGCVGGMLTFAAGGVKGVRFSEGEAQQTEVPFNQRLLYRQPQVTQVNPENGARDLPAKGFSSVVVIFSKSMDESSVRRAGVIRVVKIEDAAETDVPASVITLTNLSTGMETPAIAEYRFQSPPDAGTYRVHVSTEARDRSGRYLDQVPMQPGNQAFTSGFAVGLLSTAPMCAPCPTWCSQGGTECTAGLHCDTVSRTCKPTRCPSCSPATVCDPAYWICVPDCRVHGSYGGCPSGMTCLDSGLCG